MQANMLTGKALRRKGSARLPDSSDSSDSDAGEASEACEAIMEVIKGSQENFLLLLAMLSRPDSSIRELAEASGIPRSTCHERVAEIKTRLGRHIRFRCRGASRE